MNLMNPGQQEHRARPHRVYSNTLRLVRMGRVCRAEAGMITPYIHHTLCHSIRIEYFCSLGVENHSTTRPTRGASSPSISAKPIIPSLGYPTEARCYRSSTVRAWVSVTSSTAQLIHVAGTRDCEEFLHWLRHPLRDSIRGLETSYKNAVAAGNPAYAGGCAYGLAGTLWAVCPLPQILSTIGTQSSQAQ